MSEYSFDDKSSMVQEIACYYPDSALAPNRKQAIIWANNGQDVWCHSVITVFLTGYAD